MFLKDTITTEDTVTEYNVVFGSPFSGSPRTVKASLNTSAGSVVTSIDCAVTDVDEEGFTVKLGGNPGAGKLIKWFAGNPVETHIGRDQIVLWSDVVSYVGDQISNSTETITDYVDNKNVMKGKNGTTDPTTSDVPAGSFTVWKNTTSGNVYLTFNDAGTIKKVALT